MTNPDWPGIHSAPVAPFSVGVDSPQRCARLRRARAAPSTKNDSDATESAASTERPSSRCLGSVNARRRLGNGARVTRRISPNGRMRPTVSTAASRVILCARRNTKSMRRRLLSRMDLARNRERPARPARPSAGLTPAREPERGEAAPGRTTVKRAGGTTRSRTVHSGRSVRLGVSE